TTGVPFSRVELEANPGRSAASASYYYGSEEGETLLELFTHVYRNPTMAISKFPDFGHQNREEVAPGGPVGPRAEAHAPSRTEATSEARLGPARGVVTIDGGSATTATTYDRQDLLVVGGTSVTSGVTLPGDIRIGVVESAIRI